MAPKIECHFTPLFYHEGKSPPFSRALSYNIQNIFQIIRLLVRICFGRGNLVSIPSKKIVSVTSLLFLFLSQSEEGRTFSVYQKALYIDPQRRSRLFVLETCKYMKLQKASYWSNWSNLSGVPNIILKLHDDALKEIEVMVKWSNGLPDPWSSVASMAKKKSDLEQWNRLRTYEHEEYFMNESFHLLKAEEESCYKIKIKNQE